jgi:beta-xylosidase
MNTTRTQFLIAVLAVLPALCFGQGYMPEANPPVRQVQPILDTPLCDAAICRAKDGTYYLTGTSATTDQDGKPDFHNNDGIWLWKSTDLKKWAPLGQVWSISKAIFLAKPGTPIKSMWQTQWQILPGVPDSPRVRGITAPEVHQIRGTFVITYSVNGNGTGLLRSTTGKAEGPYEDMGMITISGGDPSIFEDDDGAVYWLWGNAWIAKMKDNLTGLAEWPRRLEFAHDDDPGRKLGTGNLRAPDDVMKEPNYGAQLLDFGRGGPFMFKGEFASWPHGNYHLVYYDYIPRMQQTACKDTLISSAPTPYGPWSSRRMMIPHGGQVTVFDDGQGNYLSTFSGSDDWAAFRDKAGIVPLVKHATVVGAPYWWAGAVIKPKYPVTMRGAWSEIQPFVDYYLRDLTVLNAPDGYYYLTGTDMNYATRKNRPARDKIGVSMWRSKDMKNWESMGLVWRCDDSSESRAGLTRLLDLNIDCPITYDVEVHYLKGTFWLVGSMQVGKHWADKDGMRILMLRSTSGKPEGPYEWMWKDKYEWRLWTPNVLEDDDGKCYLVCGGRGNFYGRLEDDLSGLAEPLKEMWPTGTYEVGEGGHLQKIGDYYFWTTALGSGAHHRGDFIEVGQFHTYDLVYCTAKSVHGPWSPTRAVPGCGNTRFFQDKHGQWWAPFMGGGFNGPWWNRPSAYPVEVRGDTIVPKR